LARVLGTTSKRVLDALTEMDGRPRSAQSVVEESEVERLREVLADQPEESDDQDVPDEPDSRLILESAKQEASASADYMPLFVAPQPVRFDYDSDDEEEDDSDDDVLAESEAAESDEDEDEEPEEEPAPPAREPAARQRPKAKKAANGSKPAKAQPDRRDRESAEGGRAAPAARAPRRPRKEGARA